MNLFREYRVFLKQFFVQYHHTGSVLPSSGALARALCRYVGMGSEVGIQGSGEAAGLAPRLQESGASSQGSGRAREILEVGPGTGAVTAKLVTRLRPDDRLTLVELNDDFVRHLRQRFETEPAFHAVAERTNIHQGRLEELPGEHCYDLVISGLPLNNFAVAEVEQILEVFARLLRRGGTLSFFEYIAIRKIKALVSSRPGRQRLHGIEQALQRTLQGREIKRDWVWPNVPPAWVHHVRFGDA